MQRHGIIGRKKVGNLGLAIAWLRNFKAKIQLYLYRFSTWCCYWSSDLFRSLFLGISDIPILPMPSFDMDTPVIIFILRSNHHVKARSTLNKKEWLINAQLGISEFKFFLVIFSTKYSCLNRGNNQKNNQLFLW
jgi:hypothetical protein